MLVKITGENKMYTTNRYKRARSVLQLKVLCTCLARAKIFENVGFFQEKRKILPSFKEILVSFRIYTDRFGVIHIRCRVRMYLVFVFPKGKYESKYGSKSDSMKKAEKQNNPNRRIYCDVKSTLNVSVSIPITSTLISGKLFIQR